MDAFILGKWHILAAVCETDDSLMDVRILRSESRSEQRLLSQFGRRRIPCHREREEPLKCEG